MDTDLHLKSLMVKETREFTATGDIHDTVTYSYFLGHHGPFELRFRKGTDSPQEVNAKIDEQRAKLRAILELARG